jgi:hypothetical protein
MGVADNAGGVHHVFARLAPFSFKGVSGLRFDGCTRPFLVAVLILNT